MIVLQVVFELMLRVAFKIVFGLYCHRGYVPICDVVQFGRSECFSPRQYDKQSTHKTQYERIMIERLQSRNGDGFDLPNVQEMSNFCYQPGLSSDVSEHPRSIFRLIHHSRRHFRATLEVSPRKRCTSCDPIGFRDASSFDLLLRECCSFTDSQIRCVCTLYHGDHVKTAFIQIL
jgi:hypothetical protein